MTPTELLEGRCEISVVRAAPGAQRLATWEVVESVDIVGRASGDERDGVDDVGVAESAQRTGCA